MMNRGLALLLLTSLSSLANDLTIGLNVRKSFATGKKVADVMLVNSGTKEITVLTRGLAQVAGYDGEKCELELSMGEATWDGRKVVTSTCDYSPVILKPGECARYEFQPHPFQSPFKRLRESASTLTVIYTISAEQGERHRVWSGSATSRTVKIVDGEIAE